MLDEIVSNTQKSSKKQEETSSLKKWLKMFDDSWTYAQQNYHTRWEENFKLYHNKNIKEPYGIVESFVPMVNSTVNTIVAALFNSNPSIKYVPNHPDQEADTRVINELYEDFSRQDGWVQKNKINGRQGIITGNYCAFYEWVNDRNGGFVHKTIVPVRDMIIDPQSTSYENWRYVGRRFFASKKELEKATIYDLEKDKDIKRYKNLDQIVQGAGANEDNDKARKDEMLGSVAPTDKDQVELIEIWTHDKMVVIANRSTIIEERENPHLTLARSLYNQRKLAHEIERQETFAVTGEDIGEFDEAFNEETAGLMPFAHGRDYEDVSLVYGSSDVDNIADQQTLLNTLTSLNLEAILYTLYPERTLDPKFSTWADDLTPGVGKVYPLPAGAMVWNNPPAIPNNAFQERLNIKDEIRETAAVSQVSKGMPTEGTTATEIKAMLGQADLRIQEKAQTLANDFFFQEAKIVLRLVQLYAPSDMVVRTLTDAGVQFEEVNPSRFLGEYTPMVKLDVTAKLEQAEKQQAAQQAFQIMIQDPTNNLQEAKAIMYKKMMPELSEEEIQRIITPQQPALPPMTEQPMEQPVEEPIPVEAQPIEQPMEEM